MSGPAFDYLDELFAELPCGFGPGAGCDPLTGDAVPVLDGAVTSGVDFTLDLGGRISGTVTDAATASPITSGSVVVVHPTLDLSSYDSLSSQGGFDIGGLPPGDYLVAADVSADHVDEWYDDHPCPGEWPESFPSAGADLVAVSPGGTTAGIDFALDRLGSLAGTVLEEGSQQPISSARVRVYNAAGAAVGNSSTYPASDGSWQRDGLWPGAYYVYSYDSSGRHLGELYDDVPCHGGPGSGCQVGQGAPLVVELNATISGVDFLLAPTGAVSGRVLDAASGAGLAGVVVRAWDATGTQVDADSTDGSGLYLVERLVPGVCFVSTDLPSSSPLVDMLYDGIPCWGGAPTGCDPTKGTAVPVTSASTTRFVDFALAGDTSGAAGTVWDRTTHAVLAGIAIDFWDASDMSYTGTAFTGSDGRYRLGLAAGTYFLASDNDQGYVNRIYVDVVCPHGSAFGGDCDPATGETVVVAGGSTTAGLDFSLERPALFEDGFETGDASAWSATVP